ncbi:MAG: outer membrane beta-barrel protein [Bacteroidales bacterium]|nr:outer membrane beta-barrel protein [Bacteroidales bacterium]
MKKFLLFIVVICFCNLSVTKAQTNQGNTLIGVSSTLGLIGTGSDLMGIGFSSMKFKSDADDFEESDTDKMTSINLLPKFGYFVTNNFALGIDLSFFYSKTKSSESNYEYSQTMFGAGPFVRYYVKTEKAKPFVEVNGSFGSITDKWKPEDGNTETDKASIMSFGGGIGMAAPVSDRVTFDVMVGYTSLTYKDKDDNDDNDRTVIGTFGIKLGFIIFLGAN